MNIPIDPPVGEIFRSPPQNLEAEQALLDL
jgi:hypothetical protein